MELEVRQIGLHVVDDSGLVQDWFGTVQTDLDWFHSLQLSLK